MKNKAIILPALAALAILGGVAASYAGLASAATATTSASGTAAVAQSHTPLGNDGTITSVNGSTLVISEEANEGGASYTVDASNASVTKDGTAVSLSAFAVGDKVQVKGAVNGSSVTATSLSNGGGKGGHAPIGQDGNVTAINGSTITMTEEADEGGATYTVNAGSATVTKDGAASSISSIVVGDKIFVQGTVSGTNVTATAIDNGHSHGGHGGRGGPEGPGQ